MPAEIFPPKDAISHGQPFCVDGVMWKFAKSYTTNGPQMFYLHRQVGPGVWGIVSTTCSVLQTELKAVTNRRDSMIFEPIDG